jgi:hypothetical protein
MKQKPRQLGSVGKIVVAMGVILVALSLVFVLIGVRLIQREGLYTSEGTTVEGTIASKRVEERNGIDRETKRPIVTRNYFLTLKFQVAEGREMEVENAVSRDRWESSHERAPIRVEYLPSDPAKSRITGDSQKLTGYLLTSLATGGALLGALLWFRNLRISPALNSDIGGTRLA